MNMLIYEWISVYHTEGFNRYVVVIGEITFSVRYDGRVEVRSSPTIIPTEGDGNWKRIYP